MQGGTVNPLVKADMTYFEYPNNGAVFSVGSISWTGSLYYNDYDNNVSKITENVLKKFYCSGFQPLDALEPKWFPLLFCGTGIHCRLSN